jgi:bacteriorhodopsin
MSPDRIVTGLVGALVTSRYKWGYFAFGEYPQSHLFAKDINKSQAISPLFISYTT